MLALAEPVGTPPSQLVAMFQSSARCACQKDGSGLSSFIHVRETSPPTVSNPSLSRYSRFGGVS